MEDIARLAFASVRAILPPNVGGLYLCVTNRADDKQCCPSLNGFKGNLRQFCNLFTGRSVSVHLARLRFDFGWVAHDSFPFICGLLPDRTIFRGTRATTILLAAVALPSTWLGLISCIASCFDTFSSNSTPKIRR